MNLSNENRLLLYFADTRIPKSTLDQGGMFPHPEIISQIYSVPLSSHKLYFYYLIYLIDFIRKDRKQISGSPGLKEVKIINRWMGPN